MAMQQKLVLQAKLSQKLILTPSLQQAIKLLPMSTLELADMLNQEITENPLLEEDVEAAANEETSTPKKKEKKAARSEKLKQAKKSRKKNKTIPSQKSTKRPFSAITSMRAIVQEWALKYPSFLRSKTRSRHLLRWQITWIGNFDSRRVMSLIWR